MDNLIYHVDFDFDIEALKKECEDLHEKNLHNSTWEYTEYGRNHIDAESFSIVQENWGHMPVGRRERKRFLQHFDLWEDDYEITNSKYLKLHANTMLMPHVDGHPCSLNIILSEDPGPINFYGKDYQYKSALVNISEKHGVNNMGQSDRLMWKISFYKNTFAEIKNTIYNYVRR